MENLPSNFVVAGTKYKIVTLLAHSRDVHDLFGVLLLPFSSPTWKHPFSFLLVVDTPNSVHVDQEEPCLVSGNDIFPLVAFNQL
jgi:hypothetical protein